jgi:hypothetical protein
MPSEMFERGRRDAEADALDENYYHYYYDYRLAYDEVIRKRRRTRRQLFVARVARTALRAVPILLLLGGFGFAGYRYVGPGRTAAFATTPTPTRTPRPTLIPPTEPPPPTPTPEPALRPGGVAVITGTDGAPLVVRRAPGKNNGLVARFREGQTVKLIEGPQEADGLQWWRIEMNGTSGWSAAPFLKPVPAPSQ